MTGFFLAAFLIFLTAFLIAGHFAFRVPQQQKAGVLQQRLRELRVRSGGARTSSRGDLVRREEAGTFAFLADFFSWSGAIGRLQEVINQADLKYRAIDVVAVSAITFVACFVLLGLFGWTVMLRLVFSLLFASLPVVLIYRKRSSRFEKFQHLLPDAINLFNRSMKAGHNIQSGLETIATESSDPVKQEFKKLIEELSLGSTLDAALHNLGKRVPIIDLKFFITGLILQRQTGANMVAVLENLAMLVRERLALREKMNAATTQSRWSAGLLCGLPILFGIVLWFMKPEYMDVLFNDPTGSKFFTYAVISEILGILVIRKLSNPKI